VNIEDIKAEINSDKYHFLQDDPDLGNRLLFLALSGSYGYGTHTPDSDIDLRGITRNSVRDLLGFRKFEQFEDKKTDTVIYNVKKIFQLLYECNPNIIEILGVRDEEILLMTPEAQKIRDNKDLFLSQRCIFSFGGFARAQLWRLQNGLSHGDISQGEKERRILKIIKQNLNYLNSQFKELDEGVLKLYLDESSREGFDLEIFMDIDIKHFSIRSFRHIFSSIFNIIKNFEFVDSRNRRKDEGDLKKHCMHLIRSLIMGTEILEGKGIHTYRPDHEKLLQIRTGEIPIEEAMAEVTELEKRFKYAADHTVLPKDPPLDQIEELMIEINRGSV
jgi:predicted nucleotidyltransferase